MKTAHEVHRLARAFNRVAFGKRSLADEIASVQQHRRMASCKESTRELMRVLANTDILLCGTRGESVAVDLHRRALARVLRMARASGKRRGVLVEEGTELE